MSSGSRATTTRGDASKTVRYWEMTPIGGMLAAANEVDDALWVSVAEAPDLLSYERDAELLAHLEAPT